MQRDVGDRAAVEPAPPPRRAARPHRPLPPEAGVQIWPQRNTDPAGDVVEIADETLRDADQFSMGLTNGIHRAPLSPR
jgi:hypothetical protein